MRELRAACAVRALAWVAVFIPMNPQRPEKNPPVRKANGTHFDWTCSTKARKAKKSPATTKHQKTTLYCCRR